MKNIKLLFIAFFSFALLVPATPAPASEAAPRFWGPISGLTDEQLALFEEGKEEFAEIDGVGDGLGPVFNGESCAECHILPAIGGSSAITVTRFGTIRGGKFDPLEELGGPLIQSKGIRLGNSVLSPEVVPPGATLVGRRETPPLFGLGLIEAIPDEVLLLLADPDDRNGNGISGRANIVKDVATGKTRVGRFGWKAQIATLMTFSADAYVNEMGITNDLFPTENAPQGSLEVLKAFDLVPDPEDLPDPKTGRRDIDNLTNFMRFLGPPPRKPASVSSVVGEILFGAIGCASCHTPVLFTGRSDVKALSFKPVVLYSNLLLHDMGPQLADGIEQGQANGREFRTTPLWGLSASAPYMHDGRAKTIKESILLHDGESYRSRRNFQRLPGLFQGFILKFLETL